MWLCENLFILGMSKYLFIHLHLFWNLPYLNKLIYSSIRSDVWSKDPGDPDLIWNSPIELPANLRQIARRIKQFIRNHLVLWTVQVSKFTLHKLLQLALIKIKQLTEKQLLKKSKRFAHIMPFISADKWFSPDDTKLW